jgi:hypothetical protein
MNLDNHPTQFLLRLSHTVVYERSTSLICIPDRDTAECERTRLQSKYGSNLLRADIRKDRPGRSGTSKTYTLRYTIRETETRTLF